MNLVEDKIECRNHTLFCLEPPFQFSKWKCSRVKEISTNISRRKKKEEGEKRERREREEREEKRESGDVRSASKKKRERERGKEEQKIIY